MSITPVHPMQRLAAQQRLLRKLASCPVRRRLNVVVDLDGVVYDFVGALRSWLIAKGYPKVGAEPQHWDFPEWGIPPERIELECMEAVAAGHLFWTGTAVEGAAEVLRAIRIEGHTIKFVTARCWSGSVEATHAWLATQGIEYDGIVFVRDKACVAADLYLDDAPHQIVALRSAGRRAVVFDQPYNRAISGERVVGWLAFWELVGTEARREAA